MLLRSVWFTVSTQYYETLFKDESMFGKRKYHKGRIKKQMWILGGVCRIHSQYYLMVMIHSTLFLFEEETFLETFR